VASLGAELRVATEGEVQAKSLVAQVALLEGVVRSLRAELNLATEGERQVASSRIFVHIGHTSAKSLRRDRTEVARCRTRVARCRAC